MSTMKESYFEELPENDYKDDMKLFQDQRDLS